MSFRERMQEEMDNKVDPFTHEVNQAKETDRYHGVSISDSDLIRDKSIGTQPISCAKPKDHLEGLKIEIEHLVNFIEEKYLDYEDQNYIVNGAMHEFRERRINAVEKLKARLNYSEKVRDSL